ncbi:Ig-like domain-containing protein [Archangium gephyra]|uniref:Ig-like domain-containing protein n=1 Tax=Archangium gephyra TaxID=48 RepID=UPI0035D45474
MFKARHFWFLVSSLAVLLSCGEPPPSAATQWVEAGRAQELRLAPRSGEVAASAAIAQLRAAPGEASQLALAQAYFPEILTGTPVDLSRVPAEALLHVRMPSSLSGDMVLTTRGLTFTVRQTGSGDTALRSSRGAAFYGDGHFWMAPGGAAAESGEWKTPRVEELLVLPQGGGAHLTLYELTLPPEVTAARDVGEYLELVDGHGVPVLRLHYSVARDAAGLSRQGQVRLLGAVAEASPVAGAPVRYAVGGTLSVEMTVDLEGLAGPVVVDPGFSSTGSLSTQRYYSGISLLPSGKVLAAGGGFGPFASCEVYDPVSGTWSGTGSMAGIRNNPVTLMLPTGKVLVTGGDYAASASTAELYDPVKGTWSTTGALPGPRRLHSLTLLRNGKVLMAGGFSGTAGVGITAASLYDPATGTWTSTASMPSGQYGHTATLLPSGEVLVAGGYVNSSSASPVMIYNPATETWRQPGTLPYRSSHTATLLTTGRVLLVSDTSSTVYDPSTGLSSNATLKMVRSLHSATLLPSGKVLVVGGSGGTGTDTTSELYDPSTNLWTTASVLPTGFTNHVAVMLPTGKVLLTANGNVLSLLYDPGEFTWGAAPSPAIKRLYSKATLLPTGKVLMPGGYGSEGYLITAELYDPDTNSWSAAGSLSLKRYDSTVTVLRSGKVLVVGGWSDTIGTSAVDVYDPVTGTWKTAAPTLQPHGSATATLLPDGKVLLAGGVSSGMGNKSELYDPETDTWRYTKGTMTVSRSDHAAIMLPTGKVLVAGGLGPVATAELYDPATETWSATGSMVTGRSSHQLALLPNGKVLTAGGPGTIVTAELYDSVTGTWSATGSTASPHYQGSMVLLPSGRVLLAGSGGGGGATVAELYDPGMGTWSSAGTMPFTRQDAAAVLLPNGKVLFAGGNWATPSGSNLFDESGTNDAWRPGLSVSTTVAPLETISVTGTRLRGISEGISVGGGNRSTPANFPVVSLMPLEGNTLLRLPLSGFSDTSLTTTLPGVIPGHYQLFATVNGISGGGLVRISDNTAPVAQPGSATTREDTPVDVALLVSDKEGGPFTYTVVSGPAHGVLSGTGASRTYTPAANYHGPDSFTFKANDGKEDSNVATVTLTVTPVNDAPVALAGSATTAEEKAVAVTLGATDVEDDTLTYTVVAGPAHGVLSGTGTSRTYTPAADYHGSDSFTFKANDGTEDSNVATITLTVTPVNDAPVALAGSVTTAEDTAVSVTLGATDVDGDTPAYTVVSGPAHGTLSGSGASLTYTPAADYHGPDSFTFKANDGTADSNEATVTLTVTPVNDRPVALVGAATTAEDTAVAVTLGATDVDGDTLAYTVLSGPSHGTLSGSGASLTYTPAADYHGPDSFTFKVNDGTEDSNVATVSLTVSAVNDAPVALADSVTTAEEKAVAVTLEATDVEGSKLTYTVVAGPAHGTLSGTGTSRTYTPAADYHGMDSFTFKANDGTADSTETTITITVTPVNDAPVAQLGSVTTAENTPVAVTLGSLDVDGDTLTYTVVSGPARGTLSGSGASLTYTPAAGYHGPDFLLFQVGDGTVESNVAAVTITVTPVNDAPVAKALSLTTAHGAPVSVRLEGTDGDGDTLSFEVVGAPANGTLSGTAPALVYTPSAGFAGEDTFTYRVSDGQSASEPVTVRITVAPAPATEPPDVSAPTGGCGGCASTAEGASLAWAGLLFLLARGSWRGRRAARRA